MAIRFRLPADRLDRVAFAYSPLLEAVLSLHVLTGPNHHSLQHPWVRKMRGLSPELKRDIQDYSFAYRGLLPEFVTPSPSDGYSTVEDELDRLRQLDRELLAFGFLRPLWDHGGDRDPARLAAPDLRRHVAARAERLGGSHTLAALAIDEPERLADGFARLLEAYWEEAFAAEWERLEPRLADTVAEAGRALAAEGLYPFLGRLSRRLHVDGEREELGIDLPHDHTVPVTDDRPLVLAPSAFTWPHVHLNCDEPWPLAVVYPAPFLGDDARPALPPSDLTLVLKALADDTRLRALQLITEQPRSTQELAPLIGMTQAGLSKHLRLLAAANLVQTRREGYYIVYSATPEAVPALSTALDSFLSRPGEEPAAY